KSINYKLCKPLGIRTTLHPPPEGRGFTVG
ncbi:MAG: hypothetical protein ACI86H_002191, partial [bacterium]